MDLSNRIPSSKIVSEWVRKKIVVTRRRSLIVDPAREKRMNLEVEMFLEPFFICLIE